jgi:hypothetical protein
VNAETAQCVNESVLAAIPLNRVLSVILLSHGSISDVIKRKKPDGILSAGLVSR